MKLFNIDDIAMLEKNAPEPGGVGSTSSGSKSFGGTTGAETVRIPIVLESYLNDLITQVSGRYRDGDDFKLINEAPTIQTEYQDLQAVRGIVSGQSEFTVQTATYVKIVIERFEEAVLNADSTIISDALKTRIKEIADRAEAALEGVIASAERNQDPDANDPRGDQTDPDIEQDNVNRPGTADDPNANPDALETTPGTADDPVANQDGLESQAGSADDGLANPDVLEPQAGTADDDIANQSLPSGTADDAFANPAAPQGNNEVATGTNNAGNNTGGNTTSGNTTGGNATTGATNAGNNSGGIDRDAIGDALKDLLGGATGDLPLSPEELVDAVVDVAEQGIEDVLDQAMGEAEDILSDVLDIEGTIEDAINDVVDDAAQEAMDQAESFANGNSDSEDTVLGSQADDNLQEDSIVVDSEPEVIEAIAPGLIFDDESDAEVDASLNPQIVAYVEANEPEIFKEIDEQVTRIMESARFTGDVSLEDIYDSLFVGQLEETYLDVYEAAVEAVMDSAEDDLEITELNGPVFLPGDGESDVDVDASLYPKVISYVESNEPEVFDAIDAQVRGFMARAFFAAGTDLQEVYDSMFVSTLERTETEIYEAAVEAVETLSEEKAEEIEAVEVVAPGLVPDDETNDADDIPQINSNDLDINPDSLPLGQADSSDALSLFNEHVVDQVETLLPELHDKLSMLVQEAYGEVGSGAEFNAAFTSMTQEYYNHVYDQISQGYDGEMPGEDALAAMEHGLQDMLDDGSDTLDELVGSSDLEPSMIREVSQDEVAQNVEVQVITNDDDLAAIIGHDII